MTTIVLADDHQIVRHGLRLILEAESDFKLLGEASDGSEAVELTSALKPDVLILDLSMPRKHGLDVIRDLKANKVHTKVIILSMHADEPYVAEALRGGACAYILKTGTAKELVKAVREVIAGKTHLSQEIAVKMMDQLSLKPQHEHLDAFDTLTKRERIILQMAAEGKTSTEIAGELFISQRTAETHRANLMRKLSLRSQTDVVRFAIRRGIISP